MRVTLQNKILHAAVPLWSLFALGIAFLLSVNSLTGKVDYTGSDAHGNLLTSQALFETGHLWLGPYLSESDSLSYAITEQNQHLVYYFPIGTPLLSIPVVAFVTSLGADLRVRAEDRVLQRILAALIVGLAFLFFYAFCLRFLPPPESLVLSATFIGGSSFVSTAGTALWSLDFGFTLTALAMALLLRARESKESLRGSSVVVAGMSLFLAFLCRPTFAVPAVLLTLETVLRSRRAGLVLIAAAVVCAIPTAVFSLREYGTLLPAYYLPGRIESHGSLLVRIAGQLVSPARGLLVYNPFLIVVLVVLVVTFQRWRSERLAWLALFWIVMHLAIIAKFPHWWGGWSYGSRLFADALPAFAVLTIVLWSDLHRSPRTFLVRWSIRLFLVFAILGFWINSYQGLHNFATLLWNGDPDVDIYPAKLFDWSHPQFLASPSRNAAQGREYYVPRLKTLPFDEHILPDSPHLYLENWFPTEHDGDDQWRWSRGKRVRLWLKTAPSNSKQRLTMSLGTVGEQTIRVFCDGTFLGEFTHRGFKPETVSWDLPPKKAGSNGSPTRRLEFRIPRARRVRDAGGWMGLGLHWLRVESTRH